MKINLSESEINDMIKRLQTLKEDIEDAQLQIANTLLEKGEEAAKQYNSSAFPSGMEESKVIMKPIKGKSESRGSSGYIALTGPNAVYDEFGTGEEGASNPHPIKSQFSYLDDYNSGPTIRINPITDRHYWIIPAGYYIPNQYVKQGGYTEGIPSGKQMYQTMQYLHRIKNDVTQSLLNNELKNYK